MEIQDTVNRNKKYGNMEFRAPTNKKIDSEIKTFLYISTMTLKLLNDWDLYDSSRTSCS